jgi:hypothetical protein
VKWDQKARKKKEGKEKKKRKVEKCKFKQNRERGTKEGEASLGT